MSGELAGRHAADMLPAYLNGTLGALEHARVRVHLAACATCRGELAQWETIGAATSVHFAGDDASVPSTAVLEGVWARIDATPWTRARLMLRPVWRTFNHALALTRTQARLIPAGIWVLSTAAMLLCFFAMGLWRAGTYPQSILGAFVPLISAIGVAFLYGPEHDAGLEVALATPASPRAILVSRLALVFGFNFALGLALTLALVVTRGGDFSALAAYWVGPTLLLSGLSLLLSLTASTFIGVASVGFLWLLRFVGSAFALPGNVLSAAPSPLGAIWLTSPVTLLLAGALLVAAVLYVPCQRRLSA